MSGTSQLIMQEILKLLTTNYVRYFSTDNAGNPETVNSATVQIDKTDPVTSDNAPAGWQFPSVTITLTPTDTGGSGVANTYYCVDQSNSCSPSASGTSILINAVGTNYGTNYIRYYSTDNVGNSETIKSTSLLIDRDTDGDSDPDSTDPDRDGDTIDNILEPVGWTVENRSCDTTVIDSWTGTSDPNLKDTDGDGLDDGGVISEKTGWDVTYTYIFVRNYRTYGDPQVADGDNDGVNDSAEQAAGSDPHRYDTDCDSKWDTNDGFEIEHGLDPLDWDTDDDDLRDGWEIDLWILAAGYDYNDTGSVPSDVLDQAVEYAKDPDVDDDGMNDGEEINFWLDQGFTLEEAVQNSNNPDVDGDGVNDTDDLCPTEDASGFDADGDGCIDTLDGLAQIIETLPDGVLSDNTKNSLVSKVENAKKSVDKDVDNAAINQLNAFINEILAQRGKKISEDAADLLAAYVQNVITLIEAG
jgi:hypothetical protein